MKLSTPFYHITSNSQQHLKTIETLAPKELLSGKEERGLHTALVGLMRNTAKYMNNYPYPSAGRVRSVSNKFRELFGHGPYDIEQLKNGRFAAVEGKLGKPVALASILKTLPTGNAKAGVLVFPEHQATTLTLGNGKTIVLDYRHRKNGTPIVMELEEYKRGLINAMETKTKQGQAHPLYALAKWMDLKHHTEKENYLKHALVHFGEDQIQNAISAATRHNTAYIHEEIGRKSDEILQMEKALKLFPDAGTYNNLGVAYFLKRKPDYPKALKYYLKAEKLNPHDANTYANLAEVYRHLGQAKSALNASQRALEIDPKHELALDELQKIRKILPEKQTTAS